MNSEPPYQTRTRTRPPDASVGRRANADARTSGKSSKPRWQKTALSVAHWATLFLAPIVLLSAIAFTILYVRLSHGPISLERIAHHVENGINADLDGLEAKIGSAVLEMSADHELELRLVDVKLLKPDGTTAAVAPLAAVELSTEALLHATIRPERIFLIKPQIALRYSESDGLILNIEAPNQDAQAPERLPTAPGTTEITKSEPPSQSNSQIFGSQVDLARIMSETMRKARSSQDAASHIKAVGVRNASLMIHTGTSTSQFTIQQGSIALEHNEQHSVITGTATVRSTARPWQLSFRAEDTAEQDLIKIAMSIEDLIPSALQANAAQFSILPPVTTPLDGQINLDLTNTGQIKDLSARFELRRGLVSMAGWSDEPLAIDAAELNLVYDPTSGVFNIAPSQIQSGASYAKFVGTINPSNSTSQETRPWLINVTTTEGIIAATDLRVIPLPLEGFDAKLMVSPSTGMTELSDLRLRASGAEISATGTINSANSQDPAITIDAAMSQIDIETLKTLWPNGLLTQTRTWISERVTKSTIASAKLRIQSKPVESDDTPADNRLSLTLDAIDIELTPTPQSLPISAKKALIRVENDAFELTVPKADLIAGETRVPLNKVRYTIVDLTRQNPVGQLAFAMESSVAKVLTAIAKSPTASTQIGKLPLDGINGKVKGSAVLTIPLTPTAGDAQAEITGKAQISELEGKLEDTQFRVRGGTINVDVSPNSVVAQGDVIINGIVAKVSMQRIQDAPADLQPPIRLTCTLDNADRTQLGLDVNYLVQGEMDVDVAIPQNPLAGQHPHVSADLTNAELILSDLAWRKAPGQTAKLEFDVIPQESKSTRLENVKLVSENMAIEGNMIIDPKLNVRKFSFPNFSLNVISRLKVDGNVTKNGIWKIKAKGTTFDAKDIFRSLLTLGSPAEAKLKPLKPAKGTDITANIDTVLGHSDIPLRSVKLKMSERNQQISSLEMNGRLEGGKTLTAQIKPGASRRLVATSDDAGRAFRLVGFYPNLRGGRLKLETELGPKGSSEKSGLLRVRDFKILGDPIIQDIYTSAETSGPAIDSGTRGKKRVVREVFEFTQMRVPFSVGHGQFVLKDAHLRGPVLGASIRGKVDYRSERLSLGGTYVPLQGINSAFCDIPLVGPIVSGLDCQGVFGITFAIQGPMSRPQVIVNPLSMLTPGIFRGIMEMTGQNPTVNPRPLGRPGQGKRSNNRRTSGTGPSTLTPAVPIDGWRSETVQVP